MRVLGIDPGLHLTGYGCVELRGVEPVLIEGGVLRFKPRDPIPKRLNQLFDDLCGLLDELRPGLVVVEKVFAHHAHPRTSILMGHARGVVLLAAARRGIDLDELAPTEIKRAIAGNGHASKHQVQHAVMAQCRLNVLPDPPDVADAIAIALCAARRVGDVVRASA